MKVGFNQRRTCQGFTTIEVIVVLVLMAVLAAGVVAGMRTPASVVAEADILRANLGYAQMLAMANNTAAWSIQFNGNSYILIRTDDNGSSSPVPWPGEGSAMHNLGTGLAIVQGAGTLNLDAWGAPAADHVLALSDGNWQEQVSITGFTGLIP